MLPAQHRGCVSWHCADDCPNSPEVDASSLCCLKMRAFDETGNREQQKRGDVSRTAATQPGNTPRVRPLKTSRVAREGGGASVCLLTELRQDCAGYLQSARPREPIRRAGGSGYPIVLWESESHLYSQAAAEKLFKLMRIWRNLVFYVRLFPWQ